MINMIIVGRLNADGAFWFAYIILARRRRCRASSISFRESFSRILYETIQSRLSSEPLPSDCCFPKI